MRTRDDYQAALDRALCDLAMLEMLADVREGNDSRERLLQARERAYAAVGHRFQQHLDALDEHMPASGSRP